MRRVRLLERPLIFIVCAPRSGSTWLRRMLDAHPEISAGQESGLFTQDGGLGSLLENYFANAPEYQLREYVDEPTLLRLIRNLAVTVLSVKANKEAKRIIVEKTPAHAFNIEAILRVFPEARFIHLIRDGRDVAASIVYGGQTWRPGWPTEIFAAAKMWKDYNEAILGAWPSLRGEALHLLRYEELLEQPERRLIDLFDFAGARPLHDDDVRHIVEQHTIERYRLSIQAESDWQLLHYGTSGQWQQTFSARDIRDFKVSAGDLLIKFGYETDRGW